jgi:EamA domain-containing membrane protein RarD
MSPVAPMMSHRRAVATMVLATLLWSIAGVVTRHLDSAASFEVTFWRSAANALAMAALLAWQMGPTRCGAACARAGRCCGGPAWAGASCTPPSWWRSR